MWLVRKITRSKWESKELSEGEIPADSVTADLRTNSNSLSLWKCDREIDDNINDVVLAIATAGDQISTFDIVWFSHEALVDDNQKLKNTDGRTPVKDLIKQHVDVYGLDYIRLGKIATQIATAITKKQCKRLTKRQVKTLIVSAVKEKRVDLDDLKEKIRTSAAGD